MNLLIIGLEINPAAAIFLRLAVFLLICILALFAITFYNYLDKYFAAKEEFDIKGTIVKVKDTETLKPLLGVIDVNAMTPSYIYSLNIKTEDGKDEVIIINPMMWAKLKDLVGQNVNLHCIKKMWSQIIYGAELLSA